MENQIDLYQRIYQQRQLNGKYNYEKLLPN
jgi:hypothetical protein